LIVYNSLQLLRDVEHLPQQNNTSAIRNNENSSLHRVDSAAALDMMQTLSTEATSRQLSLQEAKEIMADIRCLIEDRQFDPAAAVIQENGRPSALVENWVPAIGGAVLAYQTARNWFKYRGRLFQSLTQLSDIIRQVFTDWVVEPMWKIWKTIRHEEQLNLISGGAHSVINDLNVCADIIYF
jgi:hypothetical protein